MAEEHHHEELVSGIAGQLELILKKSKQAIYIYLDDVHKVCNENFANLLGYKSTKEWADNEAPLADVVEEDQKAVISAYQKAVEKFMADSLDVSMRNVKNNKLVRTRMIVAPMAYQGHIFTIHFLNQI
jgi:nitrogenase molybdenum-iron protein alpha/beta subunit